MPHFSQAEKAVRYGQASMQCLRKARNGAVNRCLWGMRGLTRAGMHMAAERAGRGIALGATPQAVRNPS